VFTTITPVTDAAPETVGLPQSIKPMETTKEANEEFSQPGFNTKPSMPDFDMPSIGSMPGMSKMSSFIDSEPDKAVEEQVKLEVSKMDVATKQNRLDKMTHTAFTRFLIHM
jgi:hypothetical protein